MGSGSSLNRLSRPARRLCTRPTACKTRKCLVMACRVSFEPSVSWAMEQGVPCDSFATSDSRVSSPNAANTGACFLLRVLCDIPLNVLHLLRPTTFVFAESLEPAGVRNFIESGFLHH